jgi:hypothetical protein
MSAWCNRTEGNTSMWGGGPFGGMGEKSCERLACNKYTCACGQLTRHGFRCGNDLFVTK